MEPACKPQGADQFKMDEPVRGKDNAKEGKRKKVAIGENRDNIR